MLARSFSHKEQFQNKFITINEVERKAPSCFTKVSSNNVSSDYIMIPTPTVIEDLGSIGWFPIDAYQVTPKRSDNVGFQKHFIKFRNPDHFIGTKADISVIPELLLVNSYDARCSLKFYVNLYRLASSSDLIVRSDQLLDDEGREKMNISHKGDKNHDYHTLSRSFKNCISIATSLMDEFAHTQLSAVEKKQFAQECCRARWDYKYQLLQPKLLLTPWREEDESDDLLTLTYLIQEKLTKGGWTGSGGRSIKPIKDPNRELMVNKKLFQIVESYHQQLTKKK